jgi:hypothetical protein
VKTVVDVLERLGRLSQGDRAWILRNLSAAAQTKLRDNMEGREPAARKEEGEATDTRVLELLDGAQAAAALAGEPAWLIATLIGMRPWPWEEQMLASIAPVTRMEVKRLRLAAPRVAPAMGQLLLKCSRERVSISSFDHLVENARTPS